MTASERLNDPRDSLNSGARPLTRGLLTHPSERKLYQFPCMPPESCPMQSNTICRKPRAGFTLSTCPRRPQRQGPRRLTSRDRVPPRVRAPEPIGSHGGEGVSAFGSPLEASANADAQRRGYDERGHGPIMSRLDTHPSFVYLEDRLPQPIPVIKFLNLCV